MGVTEPRPHVIVVGGGLAGLATAAALAPRGFRVTVLESRNRLGGRASSFHDAATGQLVDACQHVTMGCCTNYAHFCQTLGIDQFLAGQPTLNFMTADRRISPFAADPLPAPLHLARSLLRAHYLSLGDKWRIGSAILALKRADPADDQPLLPWLKRHRQNSRCLDRFWSVILVSALNETLDQLGLKYARKVIVDGFLRHRRGFEVQVPTVPLGRLYGAEMQRWFAQHDVAIEIGTGITGFDADGSQILRVRLRDGRELTADWYVLAVSFDRAAALLPAALADELAAPANNLDVSPITSVHLWFDREVLDLPHIVLVDCLGQWIFRRENHYVQVVISASRSLKGLGNEEIQRRVVAELRELFPRVANATIVRAKVVTEHAATFSAVPGVDRWRPRQQTSLSNFAIAGDWTATGWPATMEGAVRSGYLAAEVVLRGSGRHEPLVQPDL